MPNLNGSMPLVTVAMPVFNAGAFLIEAVNSIINQTYQHWELILIDDGSNDGSLDKVREIQDSRIVIISDGINMGLAPRLNQAIDLARGVYFARMDGDDISLATRLEEQVKFLTENPHVDLLATKVKTIDFQGNVIGELPFAASHQEICSRPWRSFYMPHPSWMGKLEWFKKYKYAKPAPYFCEDQELLIRSYVFSHFACLSQCLLHYRLKNSISIKKLWLTYFALFKVQANHFIKKSKVDLCACTLVYFARCVKVLIIYIKQLLSS